MRLFILTAALLCGVLAAAEVIDRSEFSAGNAAAVPPGFAAYPGREKLGGSRSFATDGGRRVLKLVDDRDDGEIGIVKRYQVRPGEYYQASIEVKRPQGVEDRNGAPFFLQFSFLPGGAWVQQRIHASDTEWRQVTLTGRVPEKTAGMEVYLYSHRAPTGALLARNYRLERSAEPFPEPVEIRTPATVRLPAAGGRMGANAQLIDDSRFPGGKAVAAEAGGNSGEVTFEFAAPEPGRYQLFLCSGTDERGAELMRKGRTKYDSLMVELAIDGGVPTRRVAYSPWIQVPAWRNELGRFGLTGKKQRFTLRLPAGLRIGYLEAVRYRPAAAPAKAAQYRPQVVPGKAHPRLWVTPESLPQVRANLTAPENCAAWEFIRREAAKPIAFKADPGREVTPEPAVLKAAANKAFVFLMGGGRERGREAAELAGSYLAHVSFGNMLDVARELGETIYLSSLVYDWCYELLTPDERKFFREKLLEFADGMEIGWPPFRQPVTNGHGNEAQLNRDLLAMGIAFYGEDDEPYRYCAYRLFEELIPMRKVEYESPRHNQGVGYGSYRFGRELHAAWLLRRMSGKEQFAPNIKSVGRFWIQARLPDGELLRDGDGILGGAYWSFPAMALLDYTYAADPVMKGEFWRQGGWRNDPVLFLLLNDPALKAEPSAAGLPLARDTGRWLGSLTVRTGWNAGPLSGDVVAEMRGGGLHFGGHQHAAGGAFQLYYRGIQAADLGQYVFYGVPYDYNVNKRSVSKNVMLCVDPAEKVPFGAFNDGGQRFVLYSPANLDEMLHRAENRAGEVLFSGFGPSRGRPVYGVFSVDLAAAYSAKVRSYVRSFVFLNFENRSHPAALIVADRMVSAKPEFRKYWQINTLGKPELTADGLLHRRTTAGRTGTMHVQMLKPAAAGRTVEIAGANQVFGKSYPPPNAAKPEANGFRTMFSPKEMRLCDDFLTVIQLANGRNEPLPCELSEQGRVRLVTVADWAVMLPADGREVKEEFQLAVPEGKTRVLLTSLQPGFWNVTTPGGDSFNFTVKQGDGTAAFDGGQGSYLLKPQQVDGCLELAVPAWEAAEVREPEGQLTLNNSPVSKLPVVEERRTLLIPVRELAARTGTVPEYSGSTLKLRRDQDESVWTEGVNSLILNGVTLNIPAAARVIGGEWYLPWEPLADFLRCDGFADLASRCVSLEKGEAGRPGGEIFQIESTAPMSREDRMNLLSPERQRGYWAARGKGVQWEAILFRPIKLRGVGIHWMNGDIRRADFRLEVSPDGRTWHTVSDGKSSGRARGFEDVTFPEQPVRRIRFTGRGNSRNDWNSIVGLRLLR